MATRSRRRKCCCCHQLYEPDPRSRYHQKYCSEPQCRKASKAASQQHWRESDKGRDYFRGSANRQRVKDWRAAHPGYARGRPSPSNRSKPPEPSRALQEDCPPQTLVLPEDKPSLALQEKIATQTLLLTGFIAHYIGCTGSALQDQIAPTIDRLIRLGQQVQGPGGGGYGGLQTSALQGTVATSPPAVQLGGPSPGP